MFKELWQRMEKAVIVTPTTRLARHLQQVYQATHQTSSPSNRIMTLQDWLMQLWEVYLQQTPEPHRLLTSWQSAIIWQDIIQQSQLNLLRPMALQRELQQAWQYVQQWKIPLTEIHAYTQVQEDNDSSLSAKWMQQYQNYMAEHQYVDEQQLMQFLQKHLKVDNFLQQNWELYGFDYLVPQLQDFCDALRHKGAHIESDIYKPPAQNLATIFYHSYTDNNELRAAAYWAYAQYKEKDTVPIAVIIPDLSKRWLEVYNIFNEIFKTENERLFNITGGLPLTEYPLIADTLLLLKFLCFSLPYAEFSHLLRSPYWSGQEFYSQRALLTRKIAKAGYQQIDLFTLKNILQHNAELADEKLVEFVTILSEEKTALNKKMLPSGGAVIFKNLIERIQWTKGRTLISSEYQQWEKWQKLLEDFARLEEIIRAPQHLSTLLGILQQQAKTIIFQPETEEVPVQVMSITDSACLQFSKIWVCSMTADTWPALPKPNPFIPLGLQKKYAIPHVSHQQEQLFAERFTQQWCHTAAEVIFSYSESEGDLHYLPSYLITQYTEPKRQDEHFILPWQKQLSAVSLEEIEDHYGEKFLEKSLRGGSRLLQEQAECPFQSYAHYRLNLAKNNLEVSAVLGEPKLRGSVLHHLLFLVWEELRSYKQLIKLSAEELSLLVEKKARQAVQNFYNNEHKNLNAPELFLEVEQKKLKELVLLWLEKEKQRQSFSIHVLEETVEIDLAGIIFTLRIDRVDKLENNEYLIIDYKTKKQPMLKEEYHRLVHPQLPLYALSTYKPLAGVVYAALIQDGLGFSGLITESQLEHLPQRKGRHFKITEFEQKCHEWQQHLTQLAQELQQGLALVNPYKTNICKKCNLNLMCRIGHQDTEDEEETYDN